MLWKTVSLPLPRRWRPPKGYDFTEQVEVARLLKDKVHGVNVTDMQSACLKASSLGLCAHLKQALTGCRFLPGEMEQKLRETGLDAAEDIYRMLRGD